jgi:peptidoglycan/xylan/chitin deacetylase (PgdA/CDA1 family)
LLSKYGAQATFFVLGQNVERFPELIEEAHEAGHVLGNHTYNHASLAGISKEDFDSQVQRTAEALGDWAAPCLRPPFGATDAFTRVYAAELGYSVVLWNIDTLDWSRPGTQAIISTILQQVYPEAIVLMHDGGGDREQTVSALETILQQLQARGYTFQPVCPP